MSQSPTLPLPVGGAVRKSAASAHNSEEEKKLKEAKSMRPRVQAQRKFAQGQSNGSSPLKAPCPSSRRLTVAHGVHLVPKGSNKAKFEVNVSSGVTEGQRPKTEDFLTFLCLRGTNLLPPELDHFNKVSPSQLASSEDHYNDEAGVDECVYSNSSSREILDSKYGGTGVAKKSARPYKTVNNASNASRANATGLSASATMLRRKMSKKPSHQNQQQRVGETTKRRLSTPTSTNSNSNGNSSCLASSSSSGMATRSSTTRRLRSSSKATIKRNTTTTMDSKNRASRRTATSTAASKVAPKLTSRKRPSAATVAAKRKTKLATINLASRMLTRLTPRGTSNAAFVQRAKKLHSSNRSLRGREISISSDEDDEQEEGEQKKGTTTVATPSSIGCNSRSKRRQSEDRSGKANVNDRPRRSLRENNCSGKEGMNSSNSALATTRRGLMKRRAMSVEASTSAGNAKRPSRKTKEAANVYLNMLGQKLSSKKDDDNISIASLNESTQERRLTELEKGIKKSCKQIKEDDDEDSVSAPASKTTSATAKFASESSVLKKIKGLNKCSSLKDLQNRLLAEAKEQITCVHDEEISAAAVNTSMKETTTISSASTDERITLSQRTGCIEVSSRSQHSKEDGQSERGTSESGVSNIVRAPPPVAFVGSQQGRRLSKDGPRKILPKTSTMPTKTKDVITTTVTTASLPTNETTTVMGANGSTTKNSIKSTTYRGPTLPSNSSKTNALISAPAQQSLVISTNLGVTKPNQQPQISCSNHLQFTGAPLIMSATAPHPQMHSLPVHLNPSAAKFEPLAHHQFAGPQGTFINPAGLQLASMTQPLPPSAPFASASFVHQNAATASAAAAFPSTFYAQNGTYRPFTPILNTVRQDGHAYKGASITTKPLDQLMPPNRSRKAMQSEVVELNQSSSIQSCSPPQLSPQQRSRRSSDEGSDEPSQSINAPSVKTTRVASADKPTSTVTGSVTTSCTKQPSDRSGVPEQLTPALSKSSTKGTSRGSESGKTDTKTGLKNPYSFNDCEESEDISPSLLFRKRKSTSSPKIVAPTTTSSSSLADDTGSNDACFPLPKELANQLEARVKREGKSSNSEMTYFIPLHSDDKGHSFGVSVKLNTEGPAGPNQKVIMKAKLVTNAQDRPPGAQIINETSSNMCDTKTKSSRLMPSVGEGEGSSTSRGQEGASEENSGNTSSNAPDCDQTRYASSQDCCLGRVERLSTFPRLGTTAHLVEAPTFAPTEEEFRDPMRFIESIRSEAEAFGMCKIIPPSGSFSPECNVQDDMRFTAYNQYVHKMMQRWGPTSKELAAIVKYLETQNVELKPHPLVAGIEVDLPALYHAVQSFGGLTDVIQKKRWSKIAEYLSIPKGPQDRGNKLYDIYCKYLLPYDTLSDVEREELMRLVEEEYEERHRNKIEKNSGDFKEKEKKGNKKDHEDKGDDEEEEEEDDDDNDDDDEDDDDEDDDMMECVVKGKSTSLSAYFRLARNMMSMLFKSGEVETREVEDHYWRLVRERDAHVQVQQGSIDTGEDNLGFPVSRESSCGRHPWNLKMLSNNPKSLLRCMGPVMGVTVPTLNVGMVFTTGCWYRDPHALPWVDYHHTGADKVWYAVPESQSIAFYTAIKQLVPTACTNKKLWLPADTCMVPPSLLVKHGVSVSRVVQSEGEFLVVFSRSFTSSLCTGYLISESVYFAPREYLKVAESEFEAIRDSREPMMFPFGKLIVSVAQNECSTKDTLLLVKPLIEKVRDNEYVKRTIISDLGVKNHERIILREKEGDQDDEYECEICSENLYISYLCDLREDTYFCLEHGIAYLQSKKPSYRKHCKLYYTHSKEEISSIIKRLNCRLESDDLEEQTPIAANMIRRQQGKTSKIPSKSTSSKLEKISKGGPTAAKSSSKSTLSSSSSCKPTSSKSSEGTAGTSSSRGSRGRRHKTRKAAEDKSGGRLTVELLDMLLSESESEESASDSDLDESDDSWK